MSVDDALALRAEKLLESARVIMREQMQDTHDPDQGDAQVLATVGIGLALVALVESVETLRGELCIALDDLRETRKTPIYRDHRDEAPI